MRPSKLGLGGVVLCVVGCSRGNPQYEAATEDTGTSGPSTTSVPGSSGSPGTTDPIPGTSQGGSTSAVATAGDDTSGADTGAPTTDTSGGAEVCDLPPAAQIAILVSSGNGAMIEPNCEGPPLMTAAGTLTVGPQTLIADNCGACDCRGEPTQAAIVSVSEAVPLPQPPACGRLFVWTETTVAGGCRWAGVAIVGDNGTTPLWLAADTRTVPTDLTAGAMIDLVDIDGCDAVDCDSAGIKALGFLNGDIVEMGEPPTLVELPFGAAIPSEVVNLTSFVDVSCREHVAWVATPIQG